MNKNKESSSEFSGPLKGLKVLDIGMLIAGPFGASLLADFGADVIKIEHPEKGDPIRGAGKNTPNGRSMAWLNEGRNKRSVTLNLKKHEGQELFKQLVGWTDILIENFSPNTLESWGLGYDVLSEINPGLVMVRVSGYGQTGPYSDKPGLDRLALGFSGLKYVNGYPEQPPVKMGVSIADYLTGAFNALSAIMAIYYRDTKEKGKGQVIDLALYEPSLRIQEDIITDYGYTGEIRERTGNRHPNYSPAEIFMTSDGKWVTIHASLDSKFKSLMKVIGKTELIEQQEYATMRDRSKQENADRLHGIIGEWVQGRKALEVINLLEQDSIPVGLVNNVEDVYQNNHVQDRENIIEVDDNELGKVSMAGIVPKFSYTPGQVYRTGAELGEDNEEVYLELLKLEEEEFNNLKEKKVI